MCFSFDYVLFLIVILNSYELGAAARELKITLVWTDAPGVVSTTKNLVNDLDLSCVDPTGATRLSNQKAAVDKVNPVEQIRFGPGDDTAATTAGVLG